MVDEEGVEFGQDPLGEALEAGRPEFSKHPLLAGALIKTAERQRPFFKLIAQFHQLFEDIPGMTTREVDERHREMFETLMEACETVGISRMSVPPLKECCGKKRIWKDERPGGLLLGDKLAWLLSKLGFKKCKGCEKRQEALNRIRWPGSG